MNAEEIIRTIKQELRANMNGVASTRMRESGLQYHLNFGIELPRLQTIASEFTPSHEIAQQLWHENVRESKMLATMLMPVERFYPELADIWVEQVPNFEIAQTAVLFLFSRLPYAPQKAFEWMASDKEMSQYCGFLLMARLLMQGVILNERSRQEFEDQAEVASQTDSLPLRKAIQNALARLPREEKTAES